MSLLPIGFHSHRAYAKNDDHKSNDKENFNPDYTYSFLKPILLPEVYEAVEYLFAMFRDDEKSTARLHHFLQETGRLPIKQQEVNSGLVTLALLASRKIHQNYIAMLLTATTDKSLYIAASTLSSLENEEQEKFYQPNFQLEFLLSKVLLESERWLHQSYESLDQTNTLAPLLRILRRNFFEVNRAHRHRRFAHIPVKQIQSKDSGKSSKTNTAAALLDSMIARRPPHQRISQIVYRIVASEGKRIEIDQEDQFGMKSEKDVEEFIEKVGAELVNQEEFESVLVTTSIEESPGTLIHLKIAADRKQGVILVQRLETHAANCRKTHFTLVLKEQAGLNKIQLCQRAEFLAKQAIAEPPISACSLLFLLETPLSMTTLCAFSRSPSWKMKNLPFVLHPLKNPQQTSEIMFDGLPTQIPLEHFLIQENILAPELAKEYAKGLALNLPKNFDRKQLLIFFAEHYYISSIERGKAKVHFPNLATNVDFKQSDPRGLIDKISEPDLLLALQKNPSPHNLHLFFHIYCPITGDEMSFISWLDYFYEQFLPTVREIQQKISPDNRDLIVQEIRDLFQSFCKKARDFNGHPSLLNHLVFPWIENRLNVIIASIPVPLRKVDFPEALVALKNKFIESATAILTNYTNLYCKFYNLKPIEIGFTYKFGTFNAGYDHRDHTIIINLGMQSLSSILMVGRLVQKGEHRERLLDGDRLLSLVPNYLGNGGVLNHELEHARRFAKGVEDNRHSNHLDAAGNFASFEACAISYATAVWERGVFGPWSKSLQDLSITDEELALLQKFEKEYYQETMAFFAK